jgi:folate-binding protein YgfZ
MSILTEQGQSAAAPSQHRGELNALLVGCGICRLERALVSLGGRDRVRWLNGMVTNNIRDLQPGRGVYNFVLTPQGHILGDLYVFNPGENLIAEIERTQLETLLAIFRKYIIMDKVEIEDLTSKFAVIGVAGPKSLDMLAFLGLPNDLAPLAIANRDWNGTSLSVVRGDNSCVLSVELWVAADKTEAVWSALLQAGAEAIGEEALETFRILCGIPKFGQDIRERTLPQETGQDRALNFTKGCYIGQEIVERIRSRGAVHKTFIGFEVEGPVPAAGTKIQNDGKDVGEITSVLAAPLKGKRLALGYLRREFAGGEKELKAGDASVRPASLPLTNLLS